MENSIIKCDIDTIETYSFENPNIVAAMVNVPKKVSVDLKRQHMPVPGHDGRYFVAWGGDNHAPYKLMKLVRDEEVTSQNMHYLTKLCYAAGIQLHDLITNQPTQDPEAVKWQRRTRLHTVFAGLCADIKAFWCAMAVIVVSNDGKMINRIVRKEMCHCRVSPRTDKERFVYYANWQNHPGKDDIEVIPLLDEDDPITDLMVRMGKEPDDNGGFMKDKGERQFAIFLRYPTMESSVYPVPAYTSVFGGGSYEQLRLISAIKKALLSNASSIKYLVEIESGYWERELTKKNINDPDKQREFVRQRKEEIKKYISGREAQGMMLMSEYYINPDKVEVHDIKITRIDTKTEGGDWNDDYSTLANIVCFAFGIHSNLVGTAAGKSQSNNSGSDKRELLAICEILEVSFHDLLKEPFELILEYNEWPLKVVIPLLLPTTLDQHKDVEQIEV